MLRLIVGGATLAAVGYALKEYCEEEACPWDEFLSSEQSREKEPSFKNGAIAKEFHKQKKSIYKKSMQEYKAFLETQNISDAELPLDSKLTKEKFSDERAEDVILYIQQISDTLEILSCNLDLEIRYFSDDKEKITQYAQSIYALSHLKLFNRKYRVNETEILSALVKAMALTSQKNSIHVDLEGSKDKSILVNLND